MYRRKNMAEIISGIYRIINTITGDFYIGSSKDVKQRLAVHKCKSSWNKQPNNPMYIDMNRYGVDKFEFQILAEVEADKLKETEQQFIETLKPAYNSNNAKGLNIERRKEHQKEYMKEYQKSEKYKEYEKSDKRKKAKKEYNKEYHKTDKYKEYQKEYQQSDKYKEYQKEFYKEYNNQLCSYNGELLTLCALSKRFQRAGIPHPQIEAKKYLLVK